MASKERRHGRESFSQQILYYGVQPPILGSVFSGLMVNYSFSGLCMETHHPLKEGHEIAIHSALFKDVMPAVVRWTKKDTAATFRVGLEFTK